MTTLHQMYCTHCTYGTAALKRAEGPLASEPFGYTVRAASMQGPQLAAAYSLVEPYLHYSLPTEMQSGSHGLTIASPPKRLFLARLENGDDLIGHVCYRETDSTGRPGSYFAHVLLAKHSAGDTPISELDCLRLWGSDWWQETDSRDIQFDLPCLDSITSAWAPGGGYINDSLFWEFLSAAPGRELEDSGRLVSSRWRRMTPQERRGMFLRVFCAALRVLDEPDSRLIVACEPEVAVLLFYGVVRLLPSLPDRAAYSFSTFESNPDKLSMTLCAVPMADTQTLASARQTFGIAGVVVDTYHADSPTSEDRFSRCAEYLLNKLLAHGWSEVDEIRCALADRSISTPSEWATTVIELNQVVEAILDPDDLAQPRIDRNSPDTISYMRRHLLRMLRQYQHPAIQLGFLINTPLKRPDHLALLDVLCRQAHVEEHIRPSVTFLLDNLTEQDLHQLLTWREIDFTHRLHALKHFVCTAMRLPAGTEWLWSSVEQNATSQEYRSILGALLSQRDCDVKDAILQSVPDSQVADVLRLSVFADDVKVSVLMSFMGRHSCLPPGCEYLWTSNTPHQTTGEPTLLCHALQHHCDDELFAAILAQSPPGTFVALLESASLRNRKQAHVLAICKYIGTRKELPRYSDSLWGLVEKQRPPADAAIVHALLRVEPATSVELHDRADKKQRSVMIRFLQAASKATSTYPLHGSACPSASRLHAYQALERIISQLPLEQILALFDEYESDFIDYYPRDPSPKELPKRMTELIRSFLQPPKDKREYDLPFRIRHAREATEVLDAKGARLLKAWAECESGIDLLSKCTSRPGLPKRKWKAPFWQVVNDPGRQRVKEKWHNDWEAATKKAGQGFYALMEEYESDRTTSKSTARDRRIRFLRLLPRCFPSTNSKSTGRDRLKRFCTLSGELRKQLPIDPPKSRKARQACAGLRYAFGEGRGLPATSHQLSFPMKVFLTLLFFFLACSVLFALARLLLGPDFFPRFDFLHKLWPFRFGIVVAESTARLLRILCRVGI